MENCKHLLTDNLIFYINYANAHTLLLIMRFNNKVLLINVTVGIKLHSHKCVNTWNALWINIIVW